MPRRVFYEWAVEQVDEHDDIQDVNHYDTLAETGYPALYDGERLVLIRDVMVWNDLYDRQWAYVENHMLPRDFDAGAKVPQTFHRELARRLT